MCGIIGIIGREDLSERLFQGLRRLEYRGYDSAGMCTIHDGKLDRRRAEGKLDNLGRVLANDPLPGKIGIAHTRWATHGAPTVANAHPHIAGDVAVVHNGIIENFKTLRDELLERGHHFESETDTEVVAHLLDEQMQAGKDPRHAVSKVLKKLRGAFALAILFKNYPDLLIGARLGSPLVVGYGDGENYLGSDALALAPLTQKISYLEEGDWVVLTREGIEVHDIEDRIVERPVVLSGASGLMVEKGNYRHFMQKEIFEQPVVVAQTLQSYLRPVEGQVALPDPDFDLSQIKRVTIVACGTSYYAGMVARYWIERFARVPVEIEAASEYRYREPVMEEGGLSLFISQSGETADTLAALRHARAGGQKIAVVVNVPTSSMAREADLLLPTHAGPEIGVASTKAFTCQLAVLAAFATHIARVKGQLTQQEEQDIVRHLAEAPAALNAALAFNDTIENVATAIAPARDVLYIGRGPDYPLAMEGALKLKEISYIHAEGYAAGEMKHGPIALIDDKVPIIVLAPSGPLFEKTVSNMQEMQARGGKVILISDEKGIQEAGDNCLATLTMPKVHPLIAPIVYAIPVQLLAYHVAVIKGTDVDQPRNLAKSVTVE
ncbi:MAG: glutamine--fructose-6-phosphate transaminase (isomerizing) [Zymomonas mobilis]|uniref:Glutamine--fructose-6-phosphate aminotransferase [isomerizing] n=1 Tax=Zymomonas mobilis subsp. mobilis (strain ATCC 10988 / DSM 424 / LMG 404 / NCIMB 8938 / NRRL B-806 / ZM1) TaxID=555217 RepID=A0A0H3FXZ6_ZYMMA|nr:glutamine--fructose-6-phosphate transaminase (isomerizing) [Zymomonas mobilis]AEH62601.1 glucosamine/fructose-6-phosphate aminotransferase, isomerizing [Zymomonas mobilis subsp. mobilis ATCC 10988]ART93604.1 glutamine--fructose-6-phosphate aminotransferase [Zymomonas mobilis subsp. mobilis]TQL27796.1 glutamine--fructose-6-phosphate transaminase [Zymomonas mobilis]TQL29735.1 glutamine--fructose-6-phosphate transaminase [Zymomonas mobilis]TWD60316.1 glutamine--fructose-6-phosphate transaminas